MKRESNGYTFREAVISDMRSICYLVGNLIDHEERLSDSTLLVEDRELRKEGIFNIMTNAITDRDYRVTVIENSAGTVTGVFVAYIDERHEAFRNSKICVIWAGFTKKSPFFLTEIDGSFMEWAKERGCTGMAINVLSNNTRFQKIIEKRLKYDRITLCYEKDITGGKS